jgi:hypothetical protein
VFFLEVGIHRGSGQTARIGNAYLHKTFELVAWADQQTFQVSWILDRTSIQKRWRVGKRVSTYLLFTERFSYCRGGRPYRFQHVKC